MQMIGNINIQFVNVSREYFITAILKEYRGMDRMMGLQSLS